jgi:hypothetical protein
MDSQTLKQVGCTPVQKGRLTCEACGSDFALVYGDRGKDSLSVITRNLLPHWWKGTQLTSMTLHWYVRIVIG